MTMLRSDKVCHNRSEPKMKGLIDVDEKNPKTKKEYLEAAKIVATCRENRVPLVVDILRQSGFEISDELVANVGHEEPKTNKMLKARRDKETQRDKWKPTDDEAVLLLRKAYDTGISFTRISEMTHDNRTVLYAYLKDRNVPEYKRQQLIDTLNELMKGRESK